MQNDLHEFRAAELVAHTGIPRTTLHYYLREGLVPPPRKPSPNSGLYSRVHVDRIRLIQRLRSQEYGALSTSRIRRVLDRVDKGVSVAVAVQMESLMGLSFPDADARWTLPDLAEHFEVPVDEIDTMVRLGLLVPDPFGRGTGFTSLEGRIAQALHRIVEETALTFQDLGPIVDTIRDLCRLEMRLRDRVVDGLERGEDNAVATLSLQGLAHLLHPYLISRSMEREIAERTARASLQEVSG